MHIIRLFNSIGDNKLNDAVYYINQSKNLATQLVANVKEG